jgi:outer membrane protein
MFARGAIWAGTGLIAWLFVGCAPGAANNSPGGAATQGGGGGSILPWSSGGVKIGYFRSDVISQRLPEYRDADNALKSDNNKWTSEAERRDTELKSKEAQLEELKLILSAERRKQLEEEIAKGRKDLQQFRQKTWYDEDSDYLKRRKELMSSIDARVNDAIYKVAEAKGLDIVFDTVAGNVVYAKPGLDITEAVLEELQR